MKLEIEVSEDTVEVFKELLEETEWSTPEYIGRAVDGLAMLISGELPGYALALPIIETLVDPPDDDEEEGDEDGDGGDA